MLAPTAEDLLEALEREAVDGRLGTEQDRGSSAQAALETDLPQPMAKGLLDALELEAVEDAGA